jgi:hypothetical protein
MKGLAGEVESKQGLMMMILVMMMMREQGTHGQKGSRKKMEEVAKETGESGIGMGESSLVVVWYIRWKESDVGGGGGSRKERSVKMLLGVSIKFDRQVMRKNDDRRSVIGKEVSRMPNRFGSTFQSKGSIGSFGRNPFEAEKSEIDESLRSRKNRSTISWLIDLPNMRSRRSGATFFSADCTTTLLNSSSSILFSLIPSASSSSSSSLTTTRTSSR